MTVEHPEFDTSLKYPGAFIKSTDAEFCRPGTRAPLVGEHNAEIYVERLGLSPQEVEALKGRGIL